MKNSKFKILVFCFFFFVIASCKKKNEKEINPQSIQPNEFAAELEKEPYAVENMQRAYDTLRALGYLPSSARTVLPVTDLYVRYYLNSENQAVKFYSDAGTVGVFDYPLHDEKYYDDSEVNYDKPGFVYMLVKPNTSLYKGCHTQYCKSCIYPTMKIQ